MIKRLDPIANESLLREAFSWDREAPSWFRQMDSIFGPDDVDDFLKGAQDLANVYLGVFQPSGHIAHYPLVGVIILTLVSNNRYTAHLCACRGARVEVLAQAAIQVKEDMFNLGMNEVFVFVAEKNRGVRKLCEIIGLQEDGITMYKGSYRGRVIKWIRMSEVRVREIARAA